MRFVQSHAFLTFLMLSIIVTQPIPLSGKQTNSQVLPRNNRSVPQQRYQGQYQFQTFPSGNQVPQSGYQVLPSPGAIPNQQIPTQQFPSQPIPNQQIPFQQFPGQPIPNQQIPFQQLPGQPIPNQQIPFQQLPGQPIPNQPNRDQELTTLRSSLRAANDNLAKRNQQVTQLNQQTTELSNENQKLRTMLQEARQSVPDDAGQEQQNLRIQQQLTDLNAEVVNITRQRDELNQTLNQEQTMTLDLKKQNQTLLAKLAQLEKMQSEADSGQAGLAELQAQFNTARQQNDELTRQLASVRASIPDADEIAALRNQNGNLNQQLQQAQTQYSALDQRTTQLTDENSQANRQIIDLQNELERMANQPAPEPVVVNNFAAADNSANLEMMGLNKKLTRSNSKFERTIDSMTEENARLVRENDELAGSLAESELRIGEFEQVDTEVAPVSAEVSSELNVPAVAALPTASGWSARHWVLGLMLLGLAVGLGFAYYEHLIGDNSGGRLASESSNLGQANRGQANRGGGQASQSQAKRDSHNRGSANRDSRDRENRDRDNRDRDDRNRGKNS